MNWTDTLRAVAPGIATLLGGPLAGAIVGELSNTLLSKPDGTLEEVAAAVASASPDVLVKLKQLENDIRTKFVDAGIRWEELTGQDRASARDLQKVTKSKVPAILAALAIVTLFAMVAALWFFGMPKDRELAAILTMLVAMMRDEVKAVYNFWFGTTASSSDKNELLRKALDH